MNYKLLEQATAWGYQCYQSSKEMGDLMKIVKNNWYFQQIDSNKWTVVINGSPQLYLTPKDLLTFLKRLNEQN